MFLVQRYKKAALKNFATSTRTPVLESLFNKVAGLKAWNFIKKRPQDRCFPVNIAKFLRLYLFWKLSWNGSFLMILMVHYMGLKIQGIDCMTMLGFRVRVTGPEPSPDQR